MANQADEKLIVSLDRGGGSFVGLVVPGTDRLTHLSPEVKDALSRYLSEIAMDILRRMYDIAAPQQPRQRGYEYEGVKITVTHLRQALEQATVHGVGAEV
ncbi:MAG: hypothetical protein AAB853_03325 [Patescibacteria group bacterium]